MLRQLIECLRAQWRAVDQPIAALDEQILALARQDATSQRLMAMPGVGPLLATALVAAVGSSAAGFRSGRSLAAWLGLVPRQHSTGGKAKLLGVARHGNRYLRRLPLSGISPDVPAGNGSIALRSMVHAARCSSGWPSGRDDRLGRWLQGLEARAHANVATVALAAKLARFAPPPGPRRCADGIDRRRRSMGDHDPQPSLSRDRLSPSARHRVHAVLLGKGGYGHHRRAASQEPVERIGPGEADGITRPAAR